MWVRSDLNGYHSCAACSHHEFHHHQWIWGGFEVLVDSYCSSWSFRCSRSKRVVVPQRCGGLVSYTWLDLSGGRCFGVQNPTCDPCLDDCKFSITLTFNLLIHLRSTIIYSPEVLTWTIIIGGSTEIWIWLSGRGDMSSCFSALDESLLPPFHLFLSIAHLESTIILLCICWWFFRNWGYTA